MESEPLRVDWPAVASALTPDGRVMFVDEGHRASHELVEGPGVLDDPATSARRPALARGEGGA